MKDVPGRMIGNLRNVDEELAKRVANGLGMELPRKNTPAKAPFDMDISPALSIHGNMKATLEGRTVAVLVDTGSDSAALKKLRTAVEKAGAILKVIAPTIAGITLSDGKEIKADGQLMGSPSQLFDAVAIIIAAEAAKRLQRDSAAVQWVSDAFGHLKAIGFTPSSKPLLDKAGVEPDDGVVETGEGFADAAAKRYWDREPKLRKLA